MDPMVTTLGLQTGLAGWKLLQGKSAKDFPALAKDPVVQREIAYFRKNAPKALTAKALLTDRRLQDFVLAAYGMTSQAGMTGLMRKVLESNPDDKSSFAGQMTDARFAKLARAFNYGVPATPLTPAVASAADVRVDRLFQESNYDGFSGSFGGVTVPYVDLGRVTNPRDMAAALQSAFRRADGGRSDISVKLEGATLKFSDALGRGSASGFTWRVNSRNTGAPPAVSDPLNVVAGQKAGTEIGGPSVSQPSFINDVVNKYMEAQFQVVIGNTSNSLREARYAMRQLPQTNNWYSVIADRPLANVIQTVLGLPQSFGTTNVDQQARTFAKRMNIKDFQDPAKLSKLITRYVAMADQQNQSSASIAAQLMDSNGSGFVNVQMPSGSGDKFSNASAAAMVMSTAFW